MSTAILASLPEFLEQSLVTVRLAILSLIRRRNWMAGISPTTFLTARRRKLTIVTPGIAVGYWKARKTPSLARWSGESSRIFCPFHVTWPWVTSYFGWPAIV